MHQPWRPAHIFFFAEGRVISSLWMELESEVPPPDRWRRRSEQYYRPVSRARYERRKMSAAGIPPATIEDNEIKDSSV